MEYRLNKYRLLESLGEWNVFLKKKVRLIACGGTALTLLEVKESTKDIDFIVPDKAEYDYLIKILASLGYDRATPFGWKRKNDIFRFDLFCGNKIHTTELIESPLKEGNHIFFKEIGNIYIGILNYYDLISSKLFRGSSVDFEDCKLLLKKKEKEIDIKVLKDRFSEMLKYEISHERIKWHLESLLIMCKKDK